MREKKMTASQEPMPLVKITQESDGEIGDIFRQIKSGSEGNIDLQFGY